MGIGRRCQQRCSCSFQPLGNCCIAKMLKDYVRGWWRTWIGLTDKEHLWALQFTYHLGFASAGGSITETADDSQYTPLHGAAGWGYNLAVKQLLEMIKAQVECTHGHPDI